MIQEQEPLAGEDDYVTYGENNYVLYENKKNNANQSTCYDE